MISFIILGSFGMIALLTGVISESMFQKNNVRIEEERLERESKRQGLTKICGELFDEAALNDKGEAPAAEVKALMPYVAKMFVKHNMTFAQSDLDSITDLMDADGSGAISKGEFVHSILSIAEGI